MVSPRIFRSWGGQTFIPSLITMPEPGRAVPPSAGPRLAFGNGRSYGDTCLPAEGCLIDTRRLSQVISFNPETGILRAGAGLMLADILALVIPHGWFLPVTPGTSLVTLGGAVANDVHGKNHHVAGTFGCFVRSLELVRSDGAQLICSPEQNAEYFAATIGGMGLTGLIKWVEISLMAVPSADVEQTIKRFDNIHDFFEREKASQSNSYYSVIWLDGLARGKTLGRGLVLNGAHSTSGAAKVRSRKGLTVPFTPPVNVIPMTGLRLMNALYFRQSTKEKRIPWPSFFYPLDQIGSWNRLYGPSGFRQFQCVIPEQSASYAIPRLLEASIQLAGGTGLSVLKKFGDIPSPGVLSFPMPGYTLTMDFANRGQKTNSLFSELEAITLDAGGRLNAYKDGLMSQAAFSVSYPLWPDMIDYIDPGFESRFSRRLGLTNGVTRPANSMQLISTATGND